MKRLWLILFLFSQPFSQTTVAVLEFETEGLDNISSSALSSIVRREVRNNNEYRLIDRNMMKAVLEEQGFQQSGCVSSECAVQVGELLGVQKMVTGTISGLGSLYLVEIFVLDVATGLIDKSEMFEHVGRVEELIKPLRDGTKKLFGAKSSEIAQDTFLYIESNPPGGMVYINNENIGSAPIKHKVAPGDYKVNIKTQGYQDWMQITSVSLGENKVLSGQLMKLELGGGGSAVGGGGIGEWEFWAISKQDYLKLVRLKITRDEWIDSFQANNMSVELIENYAKLGLPKESWLKMFLTNVPTSTAEYYYKFSVPLTLWFDIYKSGIPLNMAEFYYKHSIPAKNWVETYLTGISLEQMSSLESKHKLDISILYKYFNEIKIYGFDNVQTDLLEIKFLVMNLKFTELIYSKAGYLPSKNILSKDDFIKNMSEIDGGNDVFFTNDFNKLNSDTQQLIYRYLEVEDDFEKMEKKISKYRKRLNQQMYKRGTTKRFAQTLPYALSIGNMVLLSVNEFSQDDISRYLELYLKFVFVEDMW